MDKKNILMSTEEANMEAMRGKVNAFLSLKGGHKIEKPGPVARSDERLPGIQTVGGLILRSG